MRALDGDLQPLFADFATASNHVRILLLTSPT
jgi:hypothetical protein